MLAARSPGRQILSVSSQSLSLPSRPLNGDNGDGSCLDSWCLGLSTQADPSIPNAIVSVFMLAAVLHLLADLFCFFLFQPPLYVLVKRLQ